jgi:hypothetical protein
MAAEIAPDHPLGCTRAFEKISCMRQAKDGGDENVLNVFITRP